MKTLLVCATLIAIDGDSIRCDGVNMRVLGDGAPFEHGVDTPETARRAKCRAERMMADLATRRLDELLAGEGVTVENSGVIDDLKRPLVRVRLANGRTAGQTLIDEGYALRWEPNKKINWCGPGT